jgi:hypothetical protein
MNVYRTALKDDAHTNLISYYRPQHALMALVPSNKPLTHMHAISSYLSWAREPLVPASNDTNFEFHSSRVSNDVYYRSRHKRISHSD